MLKLQDVSLARRKSTRRILNNQISRKVQGRRIQSAQDYHRSTPDFLYQTQCASLIPNPKVSAKYIYCIFS